MACNALVLAKLNRRGCCNPRAQRGRAIFSRRYPGPAISGCRSEARPVPGKQIDDLGRTTYDGMKQKVAESEKQLAEAVQIIRELTDVVQGVRASLRPVWLYWVSSIPEKKPACNDFDVS